MSEKKMFTAEEVARMILEKAHNTLKKHEDLLQKSKNTAHELDAGEEPNNDEAECPDSLKGEGSSGASKSESNKNKSPVAESEDSEMEDQPLSESDEDEEEEGEEKEYEFKKSESGMHTVEYKTLAKKEQPLKKLMSATSAMPGSVTTTSGPSIGSQIGFPGMGKDESEEKPAPKENPQFHIRETQAGKKKKNPWSKTLRGEIDRTKTGKIKSDPEDQKRFEIEAKERRDKFMGRNKQE